MEFVVVSGLSGSGKSTVASFLEDLGFYCVDNMPVALIPHFAELCMSGGTQYERVALVTDIRGGQTFDGLFAALDELHDMNCDYKLVFVQSSTETLIHRYKETRHKHPLSGRGLSLEETVRLEKSLMEPVRNRADYIIDTTTLSSATLRGEVVRLFSPEQKATTMSVSVLSFGFKYGLPMEADLVLDVRFLPNPYYVAELRPLTGLDEKIRTFIFNSQQTLDFMRHMENLLGFLLPLYVEEGKTALVIAVGCTGGRHRSVAITRAIAELVRRRGYAASENHRDMTRG